jgi:hypothetical protein
MESDEAVLSRIHLKIKYPELMQDARQNIWDLGKPPFSGSHPARAGHSRNRRTQKQYGPYVP